LSRRTIRRTHSIVSQLLRRAWCLLCVLFLGLSLGLATVPDVSAAMPNHHDAAMDACADCPDTHHETNDGSMPDCHHVMGVALATLPTATGMAAFYFGRVAHFLPSSEIGSHHAPEHDLPPPRA